MAKNTGRGTRAGVGNGQFIEAKKHGGDFKGLRDESRSEMSIGAVYLLLLVFCCAVWAGVILWLLR